MAKGSTWSDAHQGVYDTWRRYHPASNSEASEDRRRLIRRAVRAHGAEAVSLLVAWAHDAPDRQAAFLRDQGYTALSNLLVAEKMSDRLDLAHAWEQLGRPHHLDKPSPAPVAHGGRDQGQGWMAETQQALDWARQRREERSRNAG